MTTASEARESERRRHGRLKTEGTESSLGQVMDISGSGMRIVRKGSLPVKIGESFRIDLKIVCEDNGETILPVDVTVRRIQKLGRRKFDIGVEFLNLTDENRSRLTRLARIASNSARAMW